MTKLHSATILWKLINLGTPKSLAKSTKWDTQTKLFVTNDTRLKFTRQNFNHKACNDWNEIPSYIREIKNVGSFKRNMKSWIKEQRPQMPD